MSVKNDSRLRRARKVTAAHADPGRQPPQRAPHAAAYLRAGVCPGGDRVLASASTLDGSLRSGSTGNIDAAAAVGKLVAERAGSRYRARWPSIAAATSTTGG
jgi:large subunit ribosomal protein L18